MRDNFTIELIEMKENFTAQLKKEFPTELQLEKGLTRQETILKELHQNDTNNSSVSWSVVEFLQQRIEMVEEHFNKAIENLDNKINKPVNIFKHCKFDKVSR